MTRFDLALSLAITLFVVAYGLAFFVGALVR